MPDPVGSITIDASTATAAVDFDTYVATYMAGLTVAGYPVFDNSMAFAGEEMVVSYGAGPTGKYVLAHGDLTYNFGTHIVHGEINTISFGTFGTGTYDGTTGYLTGANVDLTITGLLLANDFPGTVEEQAAVMASGEVHNFAAIAMAGANASATRIALFNQQLDAYAQTFVGSIYGDTYTGTGFNDTVTGGLGNDTIDGGDGIDTVVFSGNHADYTIVENPDGTVTVTDNNTGDGDDGTDTLSNIEKLQFQDDTYDAPVNDAPTAPVLSGAVTLGTAATVFVKEDVAVGTVVGTVSSTDPEGGTVTLALTADGDGLFELVGSELRLKGALDHETKASHTVTVTATDEAGNVTTKDVVIQVRDVLEEPEGTLAIDGSALGSAGYNMATFLATYFTGTGTGSSTFYGGTADANPYGGGVVYQNGSEVGFRYGSTDRQVILDGDLAYDFIHNGSAYGHGITGAIDSVLLAYRDGNTVPSSEADGTNGPGELTGVIPGVVISGFDIEAAAGSGNTADNLVYRLYDALRKSNIATVQTILDQYAWNVKGTTGTDILTGSRFDDILDGNGGLDILVGGDGDDLYKVGGAGSIVVENYGEGTDTVEASVSFTLGSNIERLVLTGGADIDGTGNEGANDLVGNAGRNRLDGKAGADTMAGGDGDDTYVVDDAGDVVTELEDEGDDTVEASITYTLGAHVENLVLTGSASIDATGNDLANRLTGNDGNNRLDGKAGADAMAGGKGDDTYVVDDAGDVVTELEDEGTDTVESSITYTLGDHVENLLLTGGAAIDGTGNDLDNVLTGNLGVNILTGGIGKDTLIGGKGADQLWGGADKDVFVFKALSDSTVKVAGRDMIMDFNKLDGDRINLKAIDANTKIGGNQAFTFIGKQGFHGKAGELRYQKVGSDTVIYGDVNGDRKADFAIALDQVMTLHKGLFDL